MVWKRDVDLVVPLWQGADDLRVAAGAAELARLVPTSTARLHVAVFDGPRHTRDGVRNLDAVADTLQRTRDRLIHRDPHRVLTLGGDCACDIPAVQHLAARHPGLTLYWVDAHADLNTPRTSPSGTAHGMGLRALLGEGHPDITGTPDRPALTPAQIVLVGTRDLDPPERDHISAHGIAHVTPAELAEAPRAVTAARRTGSPAYVHLDLDVCDPADLPAVGVPAPGGPRPAQVARALAAITAHHDLVGVAVCEYAPVLEHDQRHVTALLAALDLTAPG
ncbi:arginase family protein [Streptomonospora nanhaiensis]|uniref:Arginase n=1 Tax=Streptomonospora nanhaiensis TaxID=1323731 RepID=A0A853BIJ0_9ACTN|nr:arginase family protein [Streptomonospora nanhaiensis]MBV2366293.1 arginase family protein [Streptomonospora nanhaiensis]MBX9387908.1 arginase family protein [Streptomonospora nanhaiensis]NYI94421.1 arginase [Streptomonospora nanhaiensis]